MKHSEVHICYFSALDDIPKKKHGDWRFVLAILAKVGRFSVFEATESRKLANTLMFLEREGMISSETFAYPWVKVTITPKGQAALTAGSGQ